MIKVAPTLDGRLRIDLGSPIDLLALQSIVPDARLAGRRLPERLSPDGLTEDWEEFVLPELDQRFNAQLDCIDRAVAAFDPGKPGPIFIVPEQAEDWYGGLNQARLALEERHGFSQVAPEAIPAAQRPAWARALLYQGLQSAILDHLMMR